MSRRRQWDINRTLPAIYARTAMLQRLRLRKPTRHSLEDRNGEYPIVRYDHTFNMFVRITKSPNVKTRTHEPITKGH